MSQQPLSWHVEALHSYATLAMTQVLTPLYSMLQIKLGNKKSSFSLVAAMAAMSHEQSL